MVNVKLRNMQKAPNNSTNKSNCMAKEEEGGGRGQGLLGHGPLGLPANEKKGYFGHLTLA